MFARLLVARWWVPVLVVVALAGVPRVVQDPVPQDPVAPAAPQPLREAIETSGEQLAAQPPSPIAPSVPTPRRPAALLPLYGSYVGIQALDIHSTRTAIASGAGQEGNPLMKGVARSSAGLIAVKAASTVGVIWGSEKLWKKNRVAAVVMMLAVNSATAYVVAHNYGVRGNRR